MNIKCLFGRHDDGIPRLDERGDVVTECLTCFRVAKSGATLGLPDARSALAAARTRASIAELAEAGIWSGAPTREPAARSDRKAHRRAGTARARRGPSRPHAA